MFKIFRHHQQLTAMNKSTIIFEFNHYSNQAIDLIKKQQYPQAEDIFVSLFNKYNYLPSRFAARINLGNICLITEKLAYAEKYFLDASKIIKGHIAADIACGNLHLITNRISTAITFFKAARNQNPNRLEALIGLSHAHSMQLNKCKEDVSYFNKTNNVIANYAKVLKKDKTIKVSTSINFMKDFKNKYENNYKQPLQQSFTTYPHTIFPLRLLYVKLNPYGKVVPV